MQLHIIDMNDGPDGGGGAALSHALSARGVSHNVWVDDALSSGWPVDCQDVNVCWLPSDGSKPGIDAKSIVLPGTEDAIALVAGWKKAPKALSDLLAVPRHVEALLAATSDDMKSVPFALLEETTELDVIEKTFLASHLLYTDGEIAAVTDGGEAWLKIERAHRKKRLPVAAVGAKGALMFQMGLVTRGKKAAAHLALRVDQSYSAWRVAFGRVVEGKHWERLADDTAQLLGKTGFYTVWATMLQGETRPRFITARPTPPDWLSVAGEDGGALVDALLNNKPLSKSPAPQTVYSAIPIDTPVTTETLIERMPRND